MVNTESKKLNLRWAMLIFSFFFLISNSSNITLSISLSKRQGRNRDERRALISWRKPTEQTIVDYLHSLGSLDREVSQNKMKQIDYNGRSIKCNHNFSGITSE